MLCAGVADPAPSAMVDSGIPDEFGDDHRGEAVEGESPPESPVGRLPSRTHRAYWIATMHQNGMVCAFTLSVIDNGYQLAWSQDSGPPTPCKLRNHPSAFAHPAFVSAKIVEGVSWGTMQRCSLDSLLRILPLGGSHQCWGQAATDLGWSSCQ